MKTILRTTLAVCLLMISACKKKSNELVETNNPPDEQLPQKIFIPVKFVSAQLTVTLRYEENTANLVEIEGSDGYTITISYKNHQPYEIKKSSNGNVFQLVDYVKDKEGRPKARSFDKSNAVYVPTGSYVLTYDQKAQLTNIVSYKDNGELFRESTRSYTFGNISGSILLEHPDLKKNVEYTYDLKNGIFKHIPYSERLFLESRYIFFHPGQNNILTSFNARSVPENTDYSYEYNADNYPSLFTITVNNAKQTFKVSYVELKE